MPFCKECGTFYTRSVGICPKCNEAELLKAHKEEACPNDEEHKQKAKASWLKLILGLPAFILFIAGLYYIWHSLSR
ncbi:MAG TPA: hypothetical protein PKX46_02520 [Clostridia bacterium]|nr:hypothetical protein [Clostridia bacterium]HOR12774.1 hypothetical protein [Clostridia bacterium]